MLLRWVSRFDGDDSIQISRVGAERRIGPDSNTALQLSIEHILRSKKRLSANEGQMKMGSG